MISLAKYDFFFKYFLQCIKRASAFLQRGDSFYRLIHVYSLARQIQSRILLCRIPPEVGCSVHIFKGLPLFSNNGLGARERETASAPSHCIARKQRTLIFCPGNKYGNALRAYPLCLPKQFLLIHVFLAQGQKQIGKKDFLYLTVILSIMNFRKKSRGYFKLTTCLTTKPIGFTASGDNVDPFSVCKIVCPFFRCAYTRI